MGLLQICLCKGGDVLLAWLNEPILTKHSKVSQIKKKHNKNGIKSVNIIIIMDCNQEVVVWRAG
jgi:hypothetical protein